MPLFAYFDESGKFHDGSGYICLCGYLAEDKAWEEFNAAWIKLLEKHRFSHIHMTEFDSDCRIRGLGERADEILTEFIEVIRQSRLIGFSVGVDGAYFKHKYKTAGLGNRDPALFAVARILREMREAAQQWGWQTPHISVIFDEDEKFSIRCYGLVSRIRKLRPEVKDLVIAISFCDDHYFSPLQAADVLANLSNRYWRNNMDEESPEPSPLLRLLITPKDGGCFMWPKSEFWNARMIDKHWDELKRTLF